MNYFWDFIHKFKNTALIYAVKQDKTEIVKLLLADKRIDINCKSVWMHINLWYNFFLSKFNYLWNPTLLFNYTALMYASENGNIKIVQLLLSYENIDINIQNI